MTSLVWNFRDYKSILRAWIAQQPHRGHGSKAALARAAQCQTAYVSQIILGRAHMSLEQAERIARFWELSESASHFFLLLVQKDRAGTAELQRIFQQQIDSLLRKRSQLKERVPAGSQLSEVAQAHYFSSWIYPAVHLLTKIPGHSTAPRIAQRLRLSPAATEEALRFLDGAGLLTRRGENWEPGNTRMHLGHDSPLVAKHHVNWRLRAMQDIEARREESLHYSSVVTLSREDARAIRESLLQMIETAKAKVRNSKDEALFSFCLDLFEV